jgi:hypothetical protein
MPNESQRALDSVDHFVQAAADIARLPLFQEQRNRPAAADMCEIAQKLLIANEDLYRWLNLFLHFDFRDEQARHEFLKLVATYRTAKAGHKFRQLKFSCGDVWLIYPRNIEGTIDSVYAEDETTRRKAAAAFVELGSADGMMVAFIYDTVVAGIDAFVAEAEAHISQSNLNGAEMARLTFKVSSAELSQRLERFGGELADLVLVFSRLSGRPVTLG